VAGLGRKVFVAGEILQAAELQGYAVDQSVMVFDDSGARGSAIPSPSEGMVTYRKDDDLVEVFNGSAFTPVGRVLQVVSTTKTDNFTTTSTSLVDITGLTASITPSSDTNKVLVFFHTNLSNSSAGTEATRVTLLRDSTQISVGTGGSAANSSGNYQGPVSSIQTVSGTHLDSPNTTSAVTYKMQMLVSGATGMLNRRGDSTSVGVASSITVMEVAV
jgi:hypothetical protein